MRRSLSSVNTTSNGCKQKLLKDPPDDTMLNVANQPAPAEEILKRLVEGNERFIAGRPTGLGSFPYLRTELAHGQHPLATILGCSDSRVPPELIFDAGL